MSEFGGLEMVTAVGAMLQATKRRMVILVDGFIMTAHFQDGREASFILTPMEGGQSFYLVSLND